MYLLRTNSDHADFNKLIRELDSELRKRNGKMMDIYDRHNLLERMDTVILAYFDDVPVGCGCFKSFDTGSVEIKRMYVIPAARGKGLSKKVLSALEEWAIDLGFKSTLLETSIKQVEALSFYPKAGYQKIANYGPYINLPESICFHKSLLAE